VISEEERMIDRGPGRLRVAGDVVERARVGVVIPTRDRWELARGAVRTALDQREVDVEVVIVDDGSAVPAERTGPLADSRVTVLRNERPTGVSAARNKGLAATSARWRALLDDDDRWGPEKLRRQVDAALRSGARWAFSSAWHVDAALTPFQFEVAPDGADVLRRLLHANVVPAAASNVLLDAGLLHDAGSFDASFGQLADWELWLRLARIAQPATVAEGDVAYVHHGGNMAATGARTVYAEYRRLRRGYAALARSLGEEFDAPALVDWYVGRLVLGGRRFRAVFAGVEGGLRLRHPGLLWRSLRYAFRPDRIPMAYAGGEADPSPPAWLGALARAESERRALTS
jgi:glycosyltransferase involved in cell wall biosynthesis